MLISQYERNVAHYKKLARYFRFFAWWPGADEVREAKAELDREHARLVELMQEQGLLT